MSIFDFNPFNSYTKTYSDLEPQWQSRTICDPAKLQEEIIKRVYARIKKTHDELLARKLKTPKLKLIKGGIL